MSRAFFADVADALVSFLPPAQRDFQARVGSANLKVWFDDTREHYEVQIVPAAAQRAAGMKAKGPALEVGFHAEHQDAAANDRTLDRLRAREKTLRRTLGRAMEIGPFVGRQRGWGRASELWRDGDLGSPEAAIEAAERLSRYIRAIERVRSG